MEITRAGWNTQAGQNSTPWKISEPLLLEEIFQPTQNTQKKPNTSNRSDLQLLIKTVSDCPNEPCPRVQGLAYHFHSIIQVTAQDLAGKPIPWNTQEAVCLWKDCPVMVFLNLKCGDTNARKHADWRVAQVSLKIAPNFTT